MEDLMPTKFEEKIVRALRTLEDGLRRGKVEFAEDARGGAQTSIQAVISFVQTIEDFHEQQLTLPLTALLDALNSLDRGAAAPIVKPSKRPGRPSDNGLTDTVKACAIFSVDVLNDSGMPLSQAYRIVARELKALGCPIKSKKDSSAAATVRGWREGLSRRRQPDQLRDTWESLQPHRAGFRKFPPDRAWKKLRPMLAGLVNGLRPTLN